MKILHTVESYEPSIGGMQEVVKQLSERMVKLGHQVTVATKKNTGRKYKLINGVEIKEFDIDGNTVRGITGNAEAYKEFLLNSDFDVVTNFAAQQWATDIALPILDKIKAKKVFVPTGFSGLYRKEYSTYFENMKIWMKRYDANVFLSDNYRDINFARENGIINNILIPNGAAADEFLPASTIDIREKLGIASDSFLVVHVGSYTTIKGQKEAVGIFMKSKIRNAVLLLIGFQNNVYEQALKKSRRFKLWKIKNIGRNKKIIISAKFTRQETVAAYKTADVFLFPSNVECSPIVLFECMASKLPFLTTDVGNSKEIIEWSKGGILLPTTFDENGYSHANIEESSKILEQVYQHKELREQMLKQGFGAWENNFTWEIIAKKYEALYQTLLNK